MTKADGVILERKSDSVYPSSWIDRFIAWIESLPGPSWVFYGLALIGLYFFFIAIFWIDGGLPFGTFEFANSSFAFYLVYWFALYHYLSLIGSRALRTFRPLLNVDEHEFSRLEFELQTLPNRQGWLSIGLAILFTFLMIVGEPDPAGEFLGDFVPKTILPIIGDILITSLMVSALFGLLIRSIRQLRMVGRLHERASRINLLDLNPAHAFSNLTARTGMGLIFVLFLSYLQDPQEVGSGIDIYLTLAILALALVIFVLPLMGMQRRLEQEKARELGELNQLLLETKNQLHGKIRQGDYAKVGELKHGVEALMKERDLYRKISTWPWDPATFRGFGSTLLLPLLLWIATRVLEQFL
jgi:hypothetical protein